MENYRENSEKQELAGYGKQFERFLFGHWNIHGLTSEKLERIKQTDNFDVLGIVESWKNVEESVNIEGYEEFKACRKKSRNSRTYGGLSVFVKERTFASVKRLPSKSEDVVLIILCLKCSVMYIMLRSIYLPPQSSSHSNEDTWKLLSEEMAALRLKYPRMGFILMGDYNAYTADFLEQRETCDDFISDLATGLGVGWIMAGAITRGERVSKYNRLLRIDEKIK